mmetsp:Transcript_3857/g.4710  ORF Transcript_3857/g.4710 Transcript_3857/m.4710 type:complete len:121 (-) Transcript_3857:45-407(-)
MIFFLSAVHPDFFSQAIEKAKSLLKISGESYILFRDYGAYDLAMLRFLKKKKKSLLPDTFLFERGDKTLAYFFTQEELRELFTSHGFSVVSMDYCTIEIKNRKKNLTMRRVFINAVFQLI